MDVKQNRYEVPFAKIDEYDGVLRITLFDTKRGGYDSYENVVVELDPHSNRLSFIGDEIESDHFYDVEVIDEKLREKYLINEDDVYKPWWRFGQECIKGMTWLECRKRRHNEFIRTQPYKITDVRENVAESS